LDNNLFISFNSSVSDYSVPKKLVSPFETINALAKLAAEELQQHIATVAITNDNFKLNHGNDTKKIGKMFGVLVVKNNAGELGYLQGFSGKLGNSNHHSGFVPPIFDLLDENNYFNAGMRNITVLTNEINELKANPETIQSVLKTKIEFRKNTSQKLQQKLFDEYVFLNQQQESKLLREIFNDPEGKKMPAGAGECAAPKLFQYAFKNGLTPIALAEFWWGKSPKAHEKIHGEFYPPCTDKCVPILGYMLGDFK
jgi:tRNA pseudouridine32 synthase/23S rRNA pseudouridine746 synthase